MADPGLYRGVSGATTAASLPEPAPPVTFEFIRASEDQNLETWFRDEVWPCVAKLRRFLISRYPRLPDHDDIIQDSLMKLVRFKQRGPVQFARSLLWRMARNAAVDALRRHYASPYIDVTYECACTVAEDLVAIETRAEASQHRELLMQAIALLPPKCRMILLMKRIDGRSARDIADELGLAKHTVNLRVSEGIRRCAEMLRRHEEGLPMKAKRTRRRKRNAVSPRAPTTSIVE